MKLSMSIGKLATELWENRKIPTIDYKNIPKKIRNEIILYWHYEGVSDAGAASVFHCSVANIRWIRQSENKKAIHELRQTTTEVVAIDFINVANSIFCKLMAQKDYYKAWKVKAELIEKLQSMGYVKEAPRQLEITDKTDDQLDKEIKKYNDFYTRYARDITAPETAGNRPLN